MAAKRKTVTVKALVERVNRMNKESTCSREIRQGWNELLESVLHETGNYRGYGYCQKEDVPAGAAPGVRYETDARGHRVPCADYTERFRDCDDTRRRYNGPPTVGR